MKKPQETRLLKQPYSSVSVHSKENLYTYKVLVDGRVVPPPN